MKWLALPLATALLAAPAVAKAQLSLRDEPVIGRAKFLFTGASFVDNVGLENGVNCIEDSALARIEGESLPSRPTLVRAVLMVSGTLFGDDGPDYTNPDRELLVSSGLDASGADRGAVASLAQSAADRTFSFWPPGASAPVDVSAPLSSTSVAVYNRPVPDATAGNVAFFVTRIDVTDEILNEGGGVLAGDYQVGELESEVCYGLEAFCSQNESCTDVSAVHSNATASFALLLIVEDESLPLRSIAVFEGLRQLQGDEFTLALGVPTPFSDPAAGKLALYALEGDLPISAFEGTLAPCSSREYVEVDGDDDPNVDGLCLTDDDNPTGNIFNGTINSRPRNPAIEPACSGTEPLQCCQGDGLCGVTGVDIDEFNISDALAPGAETVRITVGTGTDRVALATVVLEADLFEPVLDVDTQIRVLDEVNGLVQLGAEITYLIAVSNTGNVDAKGVSVAMSVPPGLSEFEIQSIPNGAADNSAPFAGVNGTGLVAVENIDVPAGGIAEIRFKARTRCEALNTTLRPVASVGRQGILAFPVDADPVRIVGPGIERCDGIDPNGPYLDTPLGPEPERILRGGGGNCTAGASLALLLLPLGAVRRRRRR